MLCLAAHAQQQPIGHVAMQDATVTGTLEVTEGQATLSGGASIVAKDHTAQLELRRGGAVAVCATSSLHVTQGAATGEMSPLLFALDRGAIELRTLMGPHDILITPDLRFSTPSGGPLDLRVRVTSNGDTCVENHNVGAPTVEVVEQFGDGHYLVPGGQHVLFEHGNVREVVDRESSPCGCPQTAVQSLAESGVTVAPGQAARAGSQAAQRKEDHPFPAAQSQGLADTGVAKVPQAPPGEVHAQVAATMAYGAGKDSTETEASAAAPPVVAPAGAGAPVLPRAGGGAVGGSASPGVGTGTTRPTGELAGTVNAAPPAAAPRPAEQVAVKAPPPPAPPGARDIAHRIGRFFKRIFGG